jgi:hypothetical protein
MSLVAIGKHRKRIESTTEPIISVAKQICFASELLVPGQKQLNLEQNQFVLPQN